jgi:GT2 family glycosyltransferase/glycosyltransferase involved in cell wall biosynthesis
LDNLLVDLSSSLAVFGDAQVVIGRGVASAQFPRPPNAREAEAAVSDFLVKMRISATTFGCASSDANTTLALAIMKLQRQDPEASALFASVVDKHDVREGWLGLAIAHHFRGEARAAGNALAHVLSRHAVAAVPPVASSIARLAQAPGWCGLDCAGALTVELVRPLRSRSRLVASLDGEPFLLRAGPGGRGFTNQLVNGWRHAHEVRVRVDDIDLLGSPIALGGIARVEGFTDSRNGDLHGWAWCPNAPDDEPVLSISPLGGGRGITVVANEPIDIVSQTALARPRGFRVPADQLRGFTGPVHVCGADGRDLTGSPLDPSAERRNGEAASRMLANRFPAPGHETIAVSRDLVFLPVPAHVTGGPVLGGYQRRPVEVVVPVYGQLELTLACLDSVLEDLPPWARLLVIDDASPDPRVGVALSRLAVAGRITLITAAANRGFPATANTGMRHDTAHDVVLLNSDTLVPPGWLASLREAAYSMPDIGSVTPLSNNATILSYPSIDHGNAIPGLSETIGLDALARRANFGCLVDIPTAIGFCVYIKRDCLNDTGLLREDLFAQGYGEENDFCMRARHLGWRNVAVPSVFVAHVGGQSFGSAKQHLVERNMRTLNRLHPGYDALIREFQSADPMAEPRRRLDIARWESYRTGAPSVLLVTHGRRGGVQRRVAERSAMLRAEGFRPIVLCPVASRDGEGRDCVLANGPEGGTPNMRFSIPAELEMLAQILKSDEPVRAEVHHLIGHDHRLLELFARLDIRYDLVVHDYSWLCPRINLVGPSGHYCNEPDIAGCEACVADAGTMNDEAISPGTLRRRSAMELAGASSVVVSSTDVAIRLKRHFPSVQPTVESWEDDCSLPPAEATLVPFDGVRRVCVIGGIGIEKGFEILLACARDITNRKLPLRFTLVGHSCGDDRLLATGNVDISGRYEEHDAVRLIREQQAQLAWMPALWPETWSYTLTQAWQAGLNVLAFDIGTPAERIRRTERGWLCPLGLPPQALNDKMLSLRPMETDKAPPLFGPRPMRASVV